MTFKELGLIEPIIKALDKEGYSSATPIQEISIPDILKGKDLLGCAQTGTGKTAAFALPLIQKLINEGTDKSNRKIKVLVLTPTRELAIQIRDNFRKYAINTDLKCSVVLGGVNQKSQINVLRKGVDILVATPGRLLDLINQKHVKLDGLNSLVLDEADTMLDMGFIHDVKKIINNVPKERQTLLFSATMPKEISALAATILNDYVTVKANTISSAAPNIEQLLYYVDKKNKPSLLIDVLNNNKIKSVLVFTRTKYGANKLADILIKNNFKCGVIHGNKSQNARVAALNNFKSGKINILIATDIAARGIDINELSHVINFDIPELAETYVHRIGRTGRAGLKGIAISFSDFTESSLIKAIEKLIDKKIKVIDDHNYPMVDLTLKSKNKPQNNLRGSSRNNRHRNKR